MGSVTNNFKWNRIGYRIYSLCRLPFQTAYTGYHYCEHISTGGFLNPAVGTAQHWLNDEN
jgi:hypothetical protein